MTRPSQFNQILTTPYDNQRLALTIHKLDRFGNINVAQTIARYDELLLQSAQEQDSEKTQVALSSDAPKLYAFGIQHRFYIYQAELLDTDLNAPLELDGSVSWMGRDYNTWQDFYELARLHSCARNRYIVELTYLTRRMYGTITQMSASTEAQQPHKYSISFSFLATHVADEPFQTPDINNV